MEVLANDLKGMHYVLTRRLLVDPDFLRRDFLQQSVHALENRDELLVFLRQNRDSVTNEVLDGAQLLE